MLGLGLALPQRRFVVPSWVLRNPATGLPVNADLQLADDRYFVGGSVRPALADVDGWSFTRSGTRFSGSADGSLTSFGPNVPRRTDKGLAVHAGATNLLLRSSEFDNAAWTGLGISVTADQASSPDGTTSMDRVTATLAGGFLRNNAAVSVTPGTTYCFSYFSRNQTGTCAYLVYDVSNAADIVTAAYTTTGTQRQSVSFTAPAGCSLVYVYPVYQLPLDESVDIWGAQLEAGSVATPHIPTAGATASAGADAVSIDVGLSGGLWTNLGNLDPSNGVTLVLKTRWDGGSNSAPTPLAISDGTTDNSLIIYRLASGSAFRAAVADGGVFQSDMAGGADNSGSNKIAARYQADNFGVSVNGGAVATDTSGTMPSGLTTLKLGVGPNNQHDGWYIERVIAFEGALNDAQLQALSS